MCVCGGRVDGCSWNPECSRATEVQQIKQCNEWKLYYLVQFVINNPDTHKPLCVLTDQPRAAPLKNLTLWRLLVVGKMLSCSKAKVPIVNYGCKDMLCDLQRIIWGRMGWHSANVTFSPTHFTSLSHKRKSHVTFSPTQVTRPFLTNTSYVPFSSTQVTCHFLIGTRPFLTDTSHITFSPTHITRPFLTNTRHTSRSYQHTSVSYQHTIFNLLTQPPMHILYLYAPSYYIYY